MKKTVSILLAAVCVLAALCSVYAEAQPNRVYAEPISAEAGEPITVPIRIQNNEGFMGFALTVAYDADVFIPVSADSGDILNGMFNDSIATSQSGSFRIVFSGTENCAQDGTLCTITFDTVKGKIGKNKIELSSSQPDTFNELWKDVNLQCEDIRVILTENGTTAPETTTNPPAPQPKTSERMLTWLNGLPAAGRVMLWIFVYPLAKIIALFE